MVTISVLNNSVEVDDDVGGKVTMLFPKGRLNAIAHKGDGQSVDLRLMGSRKNIMSFRYDMCNMANENAEKTAEEIGKIL